MTTDYTNADTEVTKRARERLTVDPHFEAKLPMTVTSNTLYTSTTLIYNTIREVF